TLLPALSIFALHSYAFAAGNMASLGLVRVMATTVPLLALFMAWMLANAWSHFVPDRGWTRACFAALLLVHGNMSLHELREREPMPFPDDEIQRTVRIAAAYINTHRTAEQRLVYEDPLIGALCDVDPWDSTRMLPLRGIPVIEQRGIKAGDIVVWDAHFAANEGYTTLDTLLNDGRYQLDTVILPRWRITVLGDRPYSIQVFHRLEGDGVRNDSTLFVLGGESNGVPLEHPIAAPDSAGTFVFGADEFPLTLVRLPLGSVGLSNERIRVRVRLVGEAPPEAKLQLVLAQTERDGRTTYEQAAVQAGEHDVLLPVHAGSDPARTKLYFWNTSGKPFHLERFVVVREGLRDAPEPRSSPR
ncbi:MAG TPA: hypothetical protein VHL57_05460, partial [Flavobacteriales bacterium]|nr:hypothetical protein [Flavobacteriales bacterium]